jgi:hypothetical protein
MEACPLRLRPCQFFAHTMSPTRLVLGETHRHLQMPDGETQAAAKTSAAAAIGSAAFGKTKSAARWACEAALKISRLSLRNATAQGHILGDH